MIKYYNNLCEILGEKMNSPYRTYNKKINY